jgi:hypothetical protein
MSAFFERLTQPFGGAVFGPMMMPLAIGSSVLGTAIGAAGTLAAGQSAKQLGQYQQQEYLQQADTDTAVGQRKMLEEQRQGQLVQSTLQARGAASGVSGTSNSVLNLGRQIAGRTEYNSLMALSAGQDQAAGLVGMGNAAAYSGDLRQIGSEYSAVGTLAGGAGGILRQLGGPYGGFGGGYGGYGGGYGYA